MTSVLLVAPVPIGQQRTGPAIRYWELARVLSAEHQVTLLLPGDGDQPAEAARPGPTHPAFAVQKGDEADPEALLATHQVVVVQGPALQKQPRLAGRLVAGQHYLVADLYDPVILEVLEMDRGGAVGRWLYWEYQALLAEQLRLGDFFLCASERQRDYWLGALAALGRINPDTYDGTDLRRLIDVVPFGLPAEPPQPAGPVLKGVLPGIAPGDRTIIWGGGLWDWLDPLTPVQAMKQVITRQPTARLVFFQADRPQPAMVGRVRELAAGLGLLGRHIFFAPWQPPERWGACLLEADVGLSFHPANLETRFAFRTRLLDYIWAGLPIVAAHGDVLGDQVAAHGLGYLVEPGNAEALASALQALLDEPDARASRRAAFRRVAERFTWERVAGPLLHYCRRPWRAGDAASTFAERWQQAEKDHLASDLAHARRQLAAIAVQRDALAAEHARTAQWADELQARLDDMTARWQQCEAQLQAALNGRGMRLLTGTQRLVRRLRGKR